MGDDKKCVVVEINNDKRKLHDFNTFIVCTYFLSKFYF